MNSKPNALEINQTGKPANAVMRAYRAHGVVLIADFFSADRIGTPSSDVSERLAASLEGTPPKRER